MELDYFSNNLHRDIYKEIFKFLPPDDLPKLSRVSKLWNNIIGQFLWFDIVFVFDITGSVNGWTPMLNWFLFELKDYLSDRRIRIGIVGYTDHDGEAELLQTLPLVHNLSTIHNFVRDIIPHGGGDYPEAMFDGLDAALKLNWLKNSNKTIILIPDAPPHGKKFNDDIHKDDYPNGCPCGLTESVVSTIFNRNINFILMTTPYSSPGVFLKETIKIFKELHPKLTCTNFDKNNVNQKMALIMNSITNGKSTVIK